jgi:tRNA(Ile2) C34 agmatinyltransferase TiaS
VIGAPLIGFGVFMLRQGAKEEAESAEAARQRKILDMVKAQGEVSINDVVIELQSDTQTVQNMIHRLVGMGVFSGYINWEKGTLYSAEAANLRELKQCKNCGGEIKLSGKGVVSCPWCGTEYFLT